MSSSLVTFEVLIHTSLPSNPPAITIIPVEDEAEVINTTTNNNMIKKTKRKRSVDNMTKPKTKHCLKSKPVPVLCSIDESLVEDSMTELSELPMLLRHVMVKVNDNNDRRICRMCKLNKKSTFKCKQCNIFVCCAYENDSLVSNCWVKHVKQFV